MILIAESGSTKTDWRLLGEKTVAKTETIGLNPYFVDADQIAYEIKPFIENCLEKITEVHFYGTGITDDSKSEIVKSGILKALGYETKVFTYSDVIAAARALFGRKEGIACILGTGSNSCLWDGEKISFQIPPLGFWLGDEGSGGHLGKLLLLDYLHKEMPGDILEIFEKKYGILTRSEILTKAYKEDKPNKYFAGFSVFLSENRENVYCKKLIENSFSQYLEKYLLKYSQRAEYQIAFVGSIAFFYKDILEEICKKHGIEISKIIEKPMDELQRFHQND